MLLFRLDGCITITWTFAKSAIRSIDGCRTSTIASRERERECVPLELPARDFFFFFSLYLSFLPRGSGSARRPKKICSNRWFLLRLFFFLTPLRSFFLTRVPSGCLCPPFAVLAPPCHPFRYNVVRLICTADYLQLVPNVCSRTCFARKANFFVALFAHERLKTALSSFLSSSLVFRSAVFCGNTFVLQILKIGFPLRRKQLLARRIYVNFEFLQNTFILRFYVVRLLI